MCFKELDKRFAVIGSRKVTKQARNGRSQLRTRSTSKGITMIGIVGESVRLSGTVISDTVKRKPLLNLKP